MYLDIWFCYRSKIYSDISMERKYTYIYCSIYYSKQNFKKSKKRKKVYLESSYFLFFLFFPSSSSSSQKSRYLWLHIDRKCKQLLELENVTHFLRCGGSKEIAILLSSSSSIQSWKKTTTTSWGYAEAAFPCVSQKTCPIWKTICMSYYYYLPTSSILWNSFRKNIGGTDDNNAA